MFYLIILKVEANVLMIKKNSFFFIIFYFLAQCLLGAINLDPKKTTTALAQFLNWCLNVLYSYWYWLDRVSELQPLHFSLCKEEPRKFVLTPLLLICQLRYFRICIYTDCDIILNIRLAEHIIENIFLTTAMIKPKYFNRIFTKLLFWCILLNGTILGLL